MSDKPKEYVNGAHASVARPASFDVAQICKLPFSDEREQDLRKAVVEQRTALAEPLLRELEHVRDPDWFAALCGAALELGVRDERIYQALVELFEHNPLLCAGLLARYGDTRALALLERAILEFALPEASWNGVSTLADLVDAYRKLAGDLPEKLSAHVDVLRSQWLRSQAGPTPALAAPIKIGRNQDCPCNSGKKYKKCCGKPAA